MKHYITIIIASALLIPSQPLLAQKSDLGIGIGPTFFFGDLGGANAIGRPLFFDLERSLIRPVFMGTYHYQITKKFAFRLQGAYTQVAGDDKLIQPRAVFSPEWYRWYRNLNFHSQIWEISAQAELYLVHYEPGSMNWRWGPYIFVGVGMFHFNPKAEYNGTNVDLRPLHTEGEGFPGSGVKEYSLYQPCIPIGAGIRYNVTSDFTIGFEYGDRKCFTDYIDDVSSKYVSQADFNSYFANDPSKAALAYDISRRSDELDPDGVYGYVTAPGEQRGQTNNKDHFSFMQFSFNYVVGNTHVRPKNELKCMKWGGSAGSNPGAKKYHKY